MKRPGKVFSILAPALALAAPATAVTAPFVEEFAVGTSGWVNAVSGPLTWVAAGGPDGSSYVSSTLGSINAPGTIQFRGNAANGASGGAFAGDWIASGVSVLDAWVRHDAPMPVSFFFRITTGTNFPAFAGVVPVPVAPNTWTQISLAIDPGNPLLIPEGPFTFAQIFGAVTNVQIGVSVPLALENVPFSWDVDRVQIVPEPATGTILTGGLALLGWLRRRPTRA
jgi:hypothetical protein